LSGLARWYGVSIEAIQSANSGPPSQWFKPGSRLLLPALKAPGATAP